MTSMDSLTAGASLRASGRFAPGQPNDRSREIALGQRIRDRRRLMGVTRKALAARIGVSAQQIEKYETGENRVFARRLRDIASALGNDIDAFFEAPACPAVADAAPSPQCLPPELSDLLAVCAAIKSAAVRRELLGLIQAIALAQPAGRRPGTRAST